MDKRVAKKVLLIGWDSADWKIINPLLDAGLMPTLEKLINRGAMGNLMTLRPAISPILWNSIGTGKLPEKHGILGFVEPQPDGSGLRPVSSTSRKAKAIWNILTQAGLRSNVISWFASHPAEPINGVCVSNSFASTMPEENGWPVPALSVHPESLGEKLAEFRVHPFEIDENHLQPLIPRGHEIDQTQPHEQRRMNALRKYLAECASVHGAATWLMENEPWDFTAIYYNALDMICHHFMPFHPPRVETVPEHEFEIYKEVVTGVYRFHDMMLARLLQLAGEDCTVILLSDHGFHSDHLRPKAPEKINDPVAWHRSHGIFCMAGPGIVKDERIYGASLLDIVPTILTLFGLPVGEDMDGKALVQAFCTPPHIDRIPSWEKVDGEAGMHPPDLRQDPVAAAEAIQQLIDLGYMPPQTEDVQKNIKQIVSDHQCNLGISMLHHGNPGDAIPVFEQLAKDWPDEHRCRLLLAHANLAVGRLSAARVVLEQLLTKRSFPAAEMMMGSLLLAEGRHREALDQLRKAEKLFTEVPELYLRLGSAYLRARQWSEAEQSFRKSTDIEADNAESCHGLSVALLRQNRLDESMDYALRAVGLRHFFPIAHFQLGVVLARLNRPERAVLAFEHGLSMNSNFPVAHRYLARLYYRLGDFKKSHEHHEAIAKLRTESKVATAV